MTPQCSQALDTGNQYNAPAINGSEFCRHHDPQRPRKEAKDETSETESIVLPPILDNYSILIAVNEVVQALTEGRIKRSVADTLLSAIKLAVRLVKESIRQDPALTLIRRASNPRTSIDRSRPSRKGAQRFQSRDRRRLRNRRSQSPASPICDRATRINRQTAS